MSISIQVVFLWLLMAVVVKGFSPSSSSTSTTVRSLSKNHHPVSKSSTVISLGPLDFFSAAGRSSTSSIPKSPSDRLVIAISLFLCSINDSFIHSSPLTIACCLFFVSITTDATLLLYIYRDKQAIEAVKAAIENPKTPSLPLIECEFPPLEALNKLGDGSLRSANLVDDVSKTEPIRLRCGLEPMTVHCWPTIMTRMMQHYSISNLMCSIVIFLF
jgi:hypothetical protein